MLSMSITRSDIPFYNETRQLVFLKESEVATQQQEQDLLDLQRESASFLSQTSLTPLLLRGMHYSDFRQSHSMDIEFI